MKKKEVVSNSQEKEPVRKSPVKKVVKKKSPRAETHRVSSPEELGELLLSSVGKEAKARTAKKKAKLVAPRLSKKAEMEVKRLEDRIEEALYEYFEDTESYYPIWTFQGGIGVFKRKRMKVVMENNNNEFMPYEKPVERTFLLPIVIVYSRKAEKFPTVEYLSKKGLDYVVIDSPYEVEEKLGGI